MATRLRRPDGHITREYPMTDSAEPADWPDCQPPEPPVSCVSCSEPFTDARPFITAFGSSSTLLCPDCWNLCDQLEGARYDHDVNWPGNYALAALDLNEAGQRRAAGLYAAFGWCDPQDSPEATLRALLTDGAKPFPPDPQVRHDWIAGDRRRTCARCGEIRYDLNTSRDW
jgi:hypothetical protein